ncbi:PREDICTED: uncharacterized protein LOC101292301 [Fragaria vesca subsp. vesca]
MTMALRFLAQVPVMSPFPSSSKSGNLTSSVTLQPPRLIHLKIKIKRKPPLLTSIKAVDESQANSDTTEAKEEEPSPTASGSGDLGSEIKKAMEERKEKEKEGGGGDLFSGVAEEVREIEWPVFGLSVVGTVVTMRVVDRHGRRSKVDDHFNGFIFSLNPCYSKNPSTQALSLVLRLP